MSKKVYVKRNIITKMRDGVELNCDLYRPDDNKKYPVVLMRTPYCKSKNDEDRDYSDPYKLAEAGYNVVIQDVRGTGSSDGILDSLGLSEINDGYDTVEWASKQSWSDGNVGMYGLSYFGYTQLAAAETRPPALKAICPFQTSGLLPFSVGKTLTVGLYHLFWIYGRCIERLEYSKLPQEEKEKLKVALESNLERLDEMILQLPLREIISEPVEGAPELFDFVRLLDRIDDKTFWKEIHRPLDFSQMNVAMFHLTGWFDMAKDATIENFLEAKEKGTTEYMKKGQKLIIGPWAHGSSLSSTIDHIDFGFENSGVGRDVAGLTVKWFDYYLKGIENGVSNEAPISIFVMGDNIWRDEYEWPLERTVYTDYYLHSGGKANTMNGDGTLNTNVPGDEVEDIFIYDPENPVPSRINDPDGNMLIQDRTEIELREDVLIYTTDVLQTDIEVTGNVTLKLFASSSAVDTDFVAKLINVDPDGKAYSLTGGIVRARYRNGFEAELLIPGKVYEFTIDMGNISNVFKAGHRIRLELTSSDFPAWDRNLNSGEKSGEGKTPIVARQSVYHNNKYRTRLVLPIIPKT